MNVGLKYKSNKIQAIKAAYIVFFSLLAYSNIGVADNWLKIVNKKNSSLLSQSIVELPSGDLIIASESIEKKGVLIKTDGDGNILKEIAITGAQNIKKVLLTKDNNIFICGVSDSTQASETDIYWMKLDYDLNEIWRGKTFRNFNDVCESAIQHSNGNYYIVGYGSRSGNTLSDRDSYILKIDNNGNLVSSKISGSFGSDYFNNIKELPDAQLIVLGSKIWQVEMDVYLTKFDENLNDFNSKLYGGMQSEGAYGLYVMNDGFYLLGGTYSDGAGGYDILLSKLDFDFNIQFTKLYGNKTNETGYSMTKIQDHLYILGIIDTIPVKDSAVVGPKFFISKLDLDGNLLFTLESTKQTKVNSLNSLESSINNELLITFSTSFFSEKGESNIGILKTDSFKFSCCDFFKPIIFEEESINFPNRIQSFIFNNAGNQTTFNALIEPFGLRLLKNCSDKGDTSLIDLDNKTYCRNEFVLFKSNSSIEPISFEWIFGDTLGTSLISEPSFKFDTLGTFNVYLITHFECNSDTDSIVIEIVNTKPYSVGLKKEGYCIGKPILFGVDYSSDNIINYHWDFGDPLLTNDTSNLEEPYFTFNKPGTYNIKLFSKTICGSRTDSIIVTINEREEVEIDNIASSYCKNYPVAFGILANNIPDVCTWNFGDPFSTNNTFVGIDAEHIYSTAGTYVCTVITEFECNSDTDTIVVNVIDYRPVSTTISASGECANKPFSFDVENLMPNADYYWEFKEGTNTVSYDEKSFVHQFTKGGLYTIYVSITDENCNKGLDTLILNVPDFTPAIVESLNDPCLQNVVLQSKNESNTVLWVLDNGFTSTEKTLVYTFPVTGEYEVKLYTNPNTDCVDSTLVTVPFVKENANGGIYIPEVFSPNNDGNNDIFIIENTTNNPCKLKQFKVYDRWGKIIHSESNINSYSWDGKLNGKTVMPGAYIGFLEFETYVKSFLIHVVY